MFPNSIFMWSFFDGSFFVCLYASGNMFQQLKFLAKKMNICVGFGADINKLFLNSFLWICGCHKVGLCRNSNITIECLM